MGVQCFQLRMSFQRSKLPLPRMGSGCFPAAAAGIWETLGRVSSNLASQHPAGVYVKAMPGCPFSSCMPGQGGQFCFPTLSVGPLFFCPLFRSLWPKERVEGENTHSSRALATVNSSLHFCLFNTLTQPVPSPSFRCRI